MQVFKWRTYWKCLRKFIIEGEIKVQQAPLSFICGLPGSLSSKSLGSKLFCSRPRNITPITIPIKILFKQDITPRKMLKKNRKYVQMWKSRLKMFEKITKLVVEYLIKRRELNTIHSIRKSSNLGIKGCCSVGALTTSLSVPPGLIYRFRIWRL